MRNLTIKRTKSFVGCITKLKIYIEDPTSTEITINDVSCRKLGELKNGEEKTFQIEETAAKVFVIADKLSKNYCNEFYALPEGQDDIFLSGKPKLNPAVGNAFRFDNNNSEGIAESRKKNARKGGLIFTLAVVIGFIVGFSLTSGLMSGVFANKKAEPKTFSSAGITITLTDQFEEISLENYTAAFDSNKVGVLVLKEPFSMAEGFGDFTLEEYVDLVLQVNAFDSAKVQNADGLTWFTFDTRLTDAEEEYRFTAYAYKTDDAFWLVYFTMLREHADTYAPQIAEWAKSVQFYD